MPPITPCRLPHNYYLEVLTFHLIFSVASLILNFSSFLIYKYILQAIESGRLPGDILDDIPCKYVDGTLLCEASYPIP